VKKKERTRKKNEPKRRDEGELGKRELKPKELERRRGPKTKARKMEELKEKGEGGAKAEGVLKSRKER
jgi:hypothetical protein